MRRGAIMLLGLGLAVLLAWTLASMWTPVQPGERAVVRRLGRLLDEQPGPGLYRGLPWGLEQVERVAVGRVRRVAVGFQESDEPDDPQVVPIGQFLTGDHNLVNVRAEIDYRVRETETARFVLQADRVDGLVARVAESLLAEWIAGRTVDEVLVRGKVQLPAFMQSEAQRRLKDYDLGIDLEQASVTELSPPQEVKAAFDRLAEAQTEIRTKVNRTEQEAARRRSVASAEVVRLEHAAAAYAMEQKILAQAEADRFRQRLAQYQKLATERPDLLNALWLDEMGRLYATMKESGRIDVLDHALSGEGLNITQFPLQKKK